MKKTALVIFGKTLSEKERHKLQRKETYDVVIAPRALCVDFVGYGKEIIYLEDYIDAGSIYEASAFAEELSLQVLPNGQRVTKSFTYKGYELWWIHYNTLFLNLCMPYIQYKRLLVYLKNFNVVYIHGVPCNQNVFSAYLVAYGCSINFINKSRPRVLTFFPVGILIQIFLTLVFLPILVLRKHDILVFTGDKFAKDSDYDFRMEFIYKELRKRKISFVESIRSLEPWSIILGHAWKRKRGVTYATAVTFLARYISQSTWAHHKFFKQFSFDVFSSVPDAEERFRLMLATRYLATAHYDMWEIRIMRALLKLLGVKAAFIAAANERNFHTVLSCKLNNIPVVGILHGSASVHYNVYDFMCSYDGEKIMSVDKYGVWSEWWKEYYSTYSKAYNKEQLYVSGLMRPYEIPQTTITNLPQSKTPIRVLFVSEQLATPSEVLPYLQSLMCQSDISLYLVFRPYRDGFEAWLAEYAPEVLAALGEERILRNGIKEALAGGDVVVGSHSTAVLEALFQKKPMVFFETKKWGDYFNLAEYSKEYSFYAHSPEELVDLILKSKSIPADILTQLQYRFFGNPYQNGSEWVVDELVSVLHQKNV